MLTMPFSEKSVKRCVTLGFRFASSKTNLKVLSTVYISDKNACMRMAKLS